jgi:hypothetical protein
VSRSIAGLGKFRPLCRRTSCAHRERLPVVARQRSCI